jgi:succinate dehydrogenase/fumarate reductase flavoprotein subunit
VAAESVYRDFVENGEEYCIDDSVISVREDVIPPASPAIIREISDILYNALGIVRNENEMQKALKKIEKMEEKYDKNKGAIRRIRLAKMMLLSALYRKESRGAHYRSDYPERDEKFQKYIKCDYSGVIDEL